MNVERADAAASSIAAAIGVPARSRMLYCLMDGRARTATELAAVANVTPSTASIHLQKLRRQRLVKVSPQGKHRYFSLEGAGVAAALEALSVVAGGSPTRFTPTTPHFLRAARSCYDHIAGSLGVLLHDRLKTLGWLGASSQAIDAYDLTPEGVRVLQSFGIDLETTKALRRRFAFPCLDWSERRPHLGGSLGAALFDLALKRKWLSRDPDGRALSVTRFGRREFQSRFGLSAPDPLEGGD